VCGATAAREHWRSENQLRGVWTMEEDIAVTQDVRQHGSRWIPWDKLLHGRTANAIENRWYTMLQKREYRILGDMEEM
jgi:hypothetical protein